MVRWEVSAFSIGVGVVCLLSGWWMGRSGVSDGVCLFIVCVVSGSF
jgi:hypothetical protein